MSSSPLNAVGSQSNPFVVAQAAKGAPPSAHNATKKGRTSFGLVAERPDHLQSFLQQNPEMKTRLKAQVEIAMQSEKAHDNMRSKLGLSEAGMSNLRAAVGLDEQTKEPAEPRVFRDPAEQPNQGGS